MLRTSHQLPQNLNSEITSVNAVRSKALNSYQRREKLSMHSSATRTQTVLHLLNNNSTSRPSTESNSTSTTTSWRRTESSNKKRSETRPTIRTSRSKTQAPSTWTSWTDPRSINLFSTLCYISKDNHRDSTDKVAWTTTTTDKEVVKEAHTNRDNITTSNNQATCQSHKCN